MSKITPAFLFRRGRLTSLHHNFFDASYVSTVLVTIVQVVSPFWKYWDWVVIVRVTLQDVRPNAMAAHVTKAVAIVTMILYIFCLSIIVLFFVSLSASSAFFSFTVQKYNFFLTLARKSPTIGKIAGEIWKDSSPQG